MTKYLLCNKRELPPNTAKGFSLETKQGTLDLFLINQDDKVYAYKNHCPHLGVQLNWQPDMFLSRDETHIQCSTHGALFTFDKGYCIVGPCGGESLTSLTLEHDNDNDEIWLHY